MLNARTQEIIDEIIAERIAFLTTIIRTGNGVSQMAAATHISSIGTKQSDQATLELIEQFPDSDVGDLLAGALVLYSPNRETLLPKIRKLLDTKSVNETFKTLAQIDPQLLAAPPLLQEIAEALDGQFTNELHEAERELVVV